MVDFEKIRLIILDVDGTLTDGGLYYDTQGNEIKRFDVKDGLGIQVASRAGLEFAIITGRTSPMVERRARELGIRYLIQGARKKVPALEALMLQTGYSGDQIAYMGDDLNDLPVMKMVGLCACPADAAPEVRAVCHFLAPHAGGHGAVRDFLEEILRRRGIWIQTAEEIY